MIKKTIEEFALNCAWVNVVSFQQFKIDQVVTHAGNPNCSKRSGWIGQIYNVGKDFIDVRWHLDKVHSKLRMQYEQRYTEKWAVGNIKVGFTQVDKIKAVNDIKEGGLIDYILGVVNNSNYHFNSYSKYSTLGDGSPLVGLIVARKSMKSKAQHGYLGVVTKRGSGTVTVKWVLEKSGDLVTKCQPFENYYANLDLYKGCVSGFISGDYILKDQNCLLVEGDREKVEIETPVSEEETGRFIIWGPNGQRNPRVEHSSYQEAENVAEEMSRKHGGEFYICKLVGVCKKKTKIVYETERL